MMQIINSAISKISQAIRGNPKAMEFEHIVALNALTDAVDKKFLAVAVGEFPNHKDGAHAVTREHCEAMAALIVAGKLPVLVDYGHDSLWNPSAIAAGWIDKESAEVRDDGLYLAAPKWTPKAGEHIEAGEYLALSSAYVLNGVDKYGKLIPAKLRSIALTNVPYMETEVDHIPQISNAQIQEDFEMTWTDQERQALDRRGIGSLRVGGFREDLAHLPRQRAQPVGRHALGGRGGGGARIRIRRVGQAREKQVAPAGRVARHAGIQQVTLAVHLRPSALPRPLRNR